MSDEVCEELGEIVCPHGRVSLVATPTWSGENDEQVTIVRGEWPLEGLTVFLLPVSYVARCREDDTFTVLRLLLQDLADRVVHNRRGLDLD